MAAAPLPPELLDGLTDAVMGTPDALDRADAVCQVVNELYASIAWLQQADGADLELKRLRRLVKAAHAHRSWSARHPGTTRSLERADE